MRTVGILAAVALSFASLHARAEPSKAWTAAKAGLPADAKIVIGADLTAIQKTQLFATYFPKLLEKGDAGKVLDKVKASCKIDPLTAIQGVVVATTADQEDGAVYLAVAGLDKAKLSSCLVATVHDTADKTAKVSLKQDGNITQVSDGKDHTAFLGWVGKDVIVVSLHGKDKTSLVKWMGGKGALAKSDVGKSIAKLNTAATIWGAGDVSQEIQPGVTVKGGYGTVTFSKGNLDADVHAVMTNAAQATTMATSTRKQLDEAKQGNLPRTFVTMLGAVSVAAANDEVVLKGSFVEQDLLSVLALAAAGFGGP